MHQVKGPDVERGGHDDPAAELDQAVDEVQAHLPVEQTAVDMGPHHLDQCPRSEDPRKADDDPHGQRARVAMRAIHHRPFVRRKNEYALSAAHMAI